MGWCIDSYGKVFKFSGVGWSFVIDLEAESYDSGWQAITAINENDIWAVGSEAWHFDGMEWTKAELPVNWSSTYITDIWALSSADIWAVTTDSSKPLIHYNGTAWTIASSPVSCPLCVICMVSSTEGWAGGSNGTIIRYVQ